MASKTEKKPAAKAATRKSRPRPAPAAPSVIAHAPLAADSGPALAVRESKLADLSPDSHNANKGTERGAALIRQSLADYGAGRSILLDRQGRIIAGNKTAEAGTAVGLENVIVVPTDGTKIVAVQRMDLDLDDPKARSLAYADNRASEISLAWDLEVLTADLAAGVNLAAFWEPAELEKLLGITEPESGLLDGVDPDDVPEDPETRCQAGDVWQLGPHRLAVGSSTDAECVRRLLAGDALRMVWTDPPYGIAYVGKTKDALTIQNDALPPEQTGALCRAALELACGYGIPGAACYVACSANRLLPHFIAAVDGSGFAYQHSLVWLKDQFVLGRCDYHYRHEPILYGWKEGAHYFVAERTHDSIFDVPRPRKSEQHPTMKPVELVARMVQNSSRPGEIVYDPFTGSGTTLLACEQLGRVFRGCELAPGYGDVILSRWELCTGKTAALIHREEREEVTDEHERDTGDTR